MPFKRNGSERPTIDQVEPQAAIPGGDLQVRGRAFAKTPRPAVTVGEVAAPLIVGSDTYLVARVPDGTVGGQLVINNGEQTSTPFEVAIGVPLADSLHPVANPAVDADGNVYTTFSGSRGQKTPVSVYRIERGGTITPFLTELMNATGVALDKAGVLHISSRFDGMVYQATSSGSMSVFVEGMGVATGIAFDSDGNLFVGDRSGTIFKISPTRQIYVYATMEPSIAAYHLAFGPDRNLYVTGPTTSSFDSVYRVSHQGEVEVYFRGLGRPQGLAFDMDGNLYVAASISGRRGIVRITPDKQASLFLSGPNVVGLAFGPGKEMVVATTSALYRVKAGVAGRPLP
jgi:sugar lactone lactonase YvrE